MSNSALRAIDLLKHLSSSDREISISEMAQRLGVSVASASRLVQAMRDANLITRDPAKKRLFPSVNLIQLGASALRALDFREVALPAMASCSAELGRPFAVGVPDLKTGIWLETIEMKGSLLMSTLIGMPIPYHAATMGKCILAHQPTSVVEEVIGRGLHAYTDKTLIEPEALREELASIRNSGFAFNRGEFRKDGLAVAVPVVDSLGKPIFAFSTSASHNELDPQGPLVVSLVSLGKQIAGQLSPASSAPDSFV